MAAVLVFGARQVVQAEELDQLLKTATEEAQAKAEGDKAEKAAEPASDKASEGNGAKKDEDTAAKATPKPAAEAPADKPKPKYPPYAELLKDTQKLEGLITLYRKDDTLFAEIGPRQLDRDFIVLISIARGIGQTPILGGISWGFGDDGSGSSARSTTTFTSCAATCASPPRRAARREGREGRLHRQRAVQPADRTMSPQGAFVVDLTPVFMSDLPQIGFVLPGFAFSPNKSTWAAVKGCRRTSSWKSPRRMPRAA